LENENFRVDLSELPDFSPDYYLEESARGSFDNVPVPLTTPSTPILDSAPIPRVQELTRVFVLEPVIVKSCQDIASQASQQEGSNNELPNPGVNCNQLENIEGASSSAIGLNSINWPIGPSGPTAINSLIGPNGLSNPKESQMPADLDPESETLSTPILDSAPIPEVQELTRVFVLEPVIVKSCQDMALQASQEAGSNNELPNPGVNCNLENIEGASSSAIGLNSLNWPIGPSGPTAINNLNGPNGLSSPKESQMPADLDPESENMQQEFTILLPVSSETLPSTLPDSVVKEQPTPTLMGLDFNLATGGFFQIPKSA